MRVFFFFVDFCPTRLSKTFSELGHLCCCSAASRAAILFPAHGSNHSVHTTLLPRMAISLRYQALPLLLPGGSKRCVTRHKIDEFLIDGQWDVNGTKWWVHKYGWKWKGSGSQWYPRELDLNKLKISWLWNNCKKQVQHQLRRVNTSWMDMTYLPLRSCETSRR